MIAISRNKGALTLFYIYFKDLVCLAFETVIYLL